MTVLPFAKKTGAVIDPSMRLGVTAVFTLLLAVLAFAVAGCGGGEEAAPTPNTVEGTGQGGTDTGQGETETGGTETGDDTETAGPTGTETETTAEESTPAAQGNPQEGRAVYADAGCGGCHVFEEAQSTGTAGPNLDEADPSYDEALEQIRNGGGGMPAFKDQLTEKQIRDVTVFVVQGSQGGGG